MSYSPPCDCKRDSTIHPAVIFILDKHSKCKLSAKEDDKNVNNMIIEIKAPSQAKAQKMLDDVEKMFQDTYRQLTATVIKLSVSYIVNGTENKLYL